MKPSPAFLSAFKRELIGYWQTPIALIFAVFFVMASALTAFYFGSLFEGGQAELKTFFQYHPWLYLILIPALSMRLWSEERRSGTMEWISHLPVSGWTWVLAKFFAAWFVLIVVLALTTPMWITISWLGKPDHGAVVAGYFASVLLGGSMLAVGQALSLLTRHQISAFILTAAILLVFLLAGTEAVLQPVRELFALQSTDAVAGLSFLTHFQNMLRGVLDVRDVIFFMLSIFVFLAINRAVLSQVPGKG
jgi:ABC-2 type transport system permease protein